MYPLTPTENPRAQLSSPRYIYDGDTRWISFSVRFPADFPVVPSDAWLVFFQWHGRPYDGSPPVGFQVINDVIRLERNVNNGWDNPWSTPLVRGEWLDFDLQVKFDRTSAGWLDLYYGGVRQTFTGGANRLTGYTLDPDQDQSIELKPCIYRKLDSIAGVVSADFDGISHSTTKPSRVP